MRALLFAGVILGAGAAAAGAAEPKRFEWVVGDAKREALVYVPEKMKAAAAPVVFVWHGHGGSMRNAAEKMAVHTHWPEAICVYPQGLPTPGRLTDPDGKKAGWQAAAGDRGDRDLKFFDAVLGSLRKDYAVDDKRIYSTGHSNGGGFTYLLWATRGDEFAAVAPSAAVYPGVRELKPKPCLHAGGEKDALVRWEWQVRMIDAVRKLNGCAADGREWARAGKLAGTLYPSEGGTPLVTLVHPGGHEYPPDAPGLIAKFFKGHAKK